MASVKAQTLKAPSSDKTDIHIVLHDCRTRMNCDLGFSIKSQLGGNSTLLNASKATNFRYRIEGVVPSVEEIESINSISGNSKVIDRIKEIEKRGGRLVYDGAESDIFRNNLILLDSQLPEIIASLLLMQVNTGIRDLKTLSGILTQTNPCEFDSGENTPPFYEYKIKQLLATFALGMVPKTVWRGLYDANGGYLVVREDGEVLAYHFYDRNRFEDYLFHNSYLERSSTTRHDYGKIEKENDGSLYFKLNLQIRLH